MIDRSFYYSAMAIDPGATSGIAGVVLGARGRPVLVSAAGVRVPTPAAQPVRWIEAARDALDNVWTNLTIRSGHQAPIVWIERPPVTVTSDARRRHEAGGMAAWMGLGCYLGRLEALTVLRTGQPPVRIDQRHWINLHNRRHVAAKKRIVHGRDELLGSHRVLEALTVVEGAEAALSSWRDSSVKADREVAVDVAEAILIAAACCLAQRSEAKPALPRLPARPGIYDR